jgi:hypothetical protein
MGAVGVAVAMGGEEAASMFPEEWPELVAIGLGDGEGVEGGATKEGEGAFADGGWGLGDGGEDFEEEHEPVGVTGVAVFADDAGEVELVGFELEAEFFEGFAAGAGVWGFAEVGVEFAAAGAPEAEVGFLAAVEEERIALMIEGVKERGDLVGQRRGLGDAHGLAAGWPMAKRRVSVRM